MEGETVKAEREILRKQWSEPSASSDMAFHSSQLSATADRSRNCAKEELVTEVGPNRKKLLRSEGSHDFILSRLRAVSSTKAADSFYCR